MASTSPGYGITIRVDGPASAQPVSEITQAISAAGASITALDVVESVLDRVVIDVTCDAIDAEHAEAIVEALHCIETDVLEKVVISCIKHAKRSSKSLDAIFQGLIDNYTNACVYVINTPQYGTWMGATPELLLRNWHGLWN